MKILFFVILGITISFFSFGQACVPAGDQTTYGTSNVWIGYIYDNPDFTNYMGYVNEGTVASANFDESFGGDYVNYPTNGCSVYTETFSARYKLTKNFTAGTYQFMVGGDDGYRLSIDGGATWIINQWQDQSYATTAYVTTLSGTYNIVLEYYENGGSNRVSFSVGGMCTGTENQTVYGTGNVWRGYIYNGMSFNNYAGLVTEGSSGNPNFDEGFGGDVVTYNTSVCSLTTTQFSARYRLQKTFTSGSYIFTAGGDDGYRLSLDGGSTWVINKWADQSYNTTTYGAILNGTYNMVLEYYEDAGQNRLTFNVTNGLLSVKLQSFAGSVADKNVHLNWVVSDEINTDYYQVERSADGISFSELGKVTASGDSGTTKNYNYTDASAMNGINFYRLRMIDKDGTYSFSPVIKIEFTDNKAMSIYPSVVKNGLVWLTTPDALRNGIVDLYDMTGRQLQEIKLTSLAAGETISLNLVNIFSGTCVLICKSGSTIKAKQIILLNR